MIRWLRTHAVIIAFAMLALGGMLATSSLAEHAARSAVLAQWHSLRRGCARGNVLRRQLNSHYATAIESNKHVLTVFLSEASTARAMSYAATHLPSDLRAAKGYSNLLTYENAHVQIVHLPLINCADAYPRP